MKKKMELKEIIEKLAKKDMKVKRAMRLLKEEDVDSVHADFDFYEFFVGIKSGCVSVEEALEEVGFLQDAMEGWIEDCRKRMTEE